MIQLRSLCKSFGDLVAVDEVSLSLEVGETFGLLGPNGAGKSTTINMIVGALEPDSGSITVEATELSGSDRASAVRRQIGAAPQALALYDDLSATENLTFFCKLYGLSGSDLRKRVDSTLEIAQLTERKNDRVKTFSGGMKRRLNLAAALAHDPAMLLLDEPTVGVDPQSRNLIFDRIEELKSAGRTLLYTTHYMEEAERLCDRVAIIDSGKILELDTINNLIDKHGGASVVEATFAERPGPDTAIPEGLSGREFRAETSEPLAIVQQLTNCGAPLTALHVRRPDLEAVFLNLTGRSLRD